MTANLAWVGGQARMRSGDDAGDAFVDRGSERAELALGRLRSAEPRLGQLGGAPPVGGQRGLDTERSPRRRAGERLDLVEGHAGVFADGGFHDAARLLLEIVHARVGMAPAIAEGPAVEGPERGPDRLSAQERGAGRHEKT